MKYFNRVLAFFLAVLLIISYMPGSISALEDDNNTTANSVEEYSEDVSESISDTLEDDSEGLYSSANDYDDSTLAQNSEEDPLDSNADSLDELVDEENPQSDKVGIEELEDSSSEDTYNGSESDLSGDSNESSVSESDLSEETKDNESDVIASGISGKLSWTLDGQGVLTITGNDKMINFGGQAPWYEYRESIYNVIILDGVESIGNRAFKDLSSLISIVIPDSVTSIGKYAFYGCDNLTSIIIPKDVTEIGEYAFYNCNGLTSIDIPDSVTSIESSAFEKCSNLTSIVISNSITSMGDYLFMGCSSLTSFEIPSGVTDIGNRVFCDCSSLTNITIPYGVTRIGDRAFSGCSSLISIDIPDSVTSIETAAFEKCSNLTSIVIPNSVTGIGGSMFMDCSSLTSIVIPNSVTGIGGSMFMNCRSLTNIVIPEGVTSIENNTFNGCSSLASIVIPNSITSIHDGAFYGCSNLTSIVIPDSVTSIGRVALGNCSSLTSIVIPKGVSKIENQVFFGCSNLTSIMIPDGVTSIGEEAFYKCNSLSSISIPNSVTSIGDNAFYKCGLKDIYYAGSAEEWNQITIGEYNYNLINATKHYTIASGTCDDNLTWTLYTEGLFVLDGSGAMPDYGNRGTPWYDYRDQITKVVISEGITTVGSGAFFSSSNLSSVVIPKGVTRINENAFIMCHNLTSITLPVELTKIEGFAFNLCDSLTEISYPGTYDDWSRISIGENNGPLEKAAIDYFTIGKTFSAPEYEWEYNSGNYFLTGRIACIEIPDIVIKEYASVDSEIEKESTCTEEGIIKYIASFEDPRFETQERTETTPALGHDLEHFDAVEATTEEDGNIEYWYCDRCGQYFKDADATQETTWEELVLPQYQDIVLADAVAADQVYTGKESKPIPRVEFQGTLLKQDQDYTLSYAQNTNAGTAVITIRGINRFYGSKTITFTIAPKKVTPKVTLSTNAFTYDGKVKKPSITVKAEGTELTAASYTVSYAKGRKNVGKYKITVKLKGNYSGSKTVYFKINPKGATLATSTAASKAITVKWKKQSAKMASSRISGYQIQLATNSKFTKNKKTVTVSGYSKTSKKVTKLKGKTKYYIRIRTYKTVGGVKYYSPWSKVKTITTKK